MNLSLDLKIDFFNLKFSNACRCTSQPAQGSAPFLAVGLTRGFCDWPLWCSEAMRDSTQFHVFATVVIAREYFLFSERLEATLNGQRTHLGAHQSWAQIPEQAVELWMHYTSFWSLSFLQCKMGIMCSLNISLIPSSPWARC